VDFGSPVNLIHQRAAKRSRQVEFYTFYAPDCEYYERVVFWFSLFAREHSPSAESAPRTSVKAAVSLARPAEWCGVVDGEGPSRISLAYIHMCACAGVHTIAAGECVKVVPSDTPTHTHYRTCQGQVRKCGNGGLFCCFPHFPTLSPPFWIF